MKIRKKDLTTTILITVGVFAVILTIVNFYLLSQKGKGSNNPQSTDINAILSGNSPSIGSKDAFVTIVEFSDYQCPVCKRFYDDIYLELKEKYIDTGKVKFVYRDFPLSGLHPYAQKAAEAGQCANEQGKFWEYSELMFQYSPKLDVDSLKGYAADAGLDTGKFSSCLDSGKMAESVSKDLSDGESNNVRGTPTLFVNGKIIPGLPDKAQFFQMIELEIIKVRSGGQE